MFRRTVGSLQDYRQRRAKAATLAPPPEIPASELIILTAVDSLAASSPPRMTALRFLGLLAFPAPIQIAAKTVAGYRLPQLVKTANLVGGIAVAGQAAVGEIVR